MAEDTVVVRLKTNSHSVLFVMKAGQTIEKGVLNVYPGCQEKLKKISYKNTSGEVKPTEIIKNLPKVKDEVLNIEVNQLQATDAQNPLFLDSNIAFRQSGEVLTYIYNKQKNPEVELNGQSLMKLELMNIKELFKFLSEKQSSDIDAMLGSKKMLKDVVEKGIAAKTITKFIDSYAEWVKKMGQEESFFQALRTLVSRSGESIPSQESEIENIPGVQRWSQRQQGIYKLVSSFIINRCRVKQDLQKKLQEHHTYMKEAMEKCIQNENKAKTQKRDQKEIAKKQQEQKEKQKQKQKQKQQEQNNKKIEQSKQQQINKALENQKVKLLAQYRKSLKITSQLGHYLQTQQPEIIELLGKKIFEVTQKKVKWIEVLYSLSFKMQKKYHHNFHLRPNLVLVAKFGNGQIIGAYFRETFENQMKDGPGFLFHWSKKTQGKGPNIYKLKNGKKAIGIEDTILSLGNEEISFSLDNKTLQLNLLEGNESSFQLVQGANELQKQGDIKVELMDVCEAKME